MDGNRRRASTWFEWIVGIVGLLVCCAYFPTLTAHNLFLTALIFAIAIYLESRPVPIGKVISSLLIALPIGVMVVYGSGEAVWLLAVAELVSPFFAKEQSRISTRFFNAGQYAISATAMLFVYHCVYHGPINPQLTWDVFFAVLAGTAAFVVVNHLFIHVLSLVRGSFELRDTITVLISDGINVLIALPFSFLMIALSPYHPILGPIAMMPIALLAQTLRTHQRATFLQRVYAATSHLASEFDVEKICTEVAQSVRALTYADCVVVFTLTDDGDLLLPTVVDPLDEAAAVGTVGIHKDEGGVIWHAIRQQGWAYVPDVRKDSRVRFLGSEPHFLSMTIFPMQRHGAVQGAIVCYASRPYAFGALTEYISVMASQVSVLLENAKLYQRLQEQSWRDGATGLYNYRYFYAALSQHVGLAAQSGKPVSVAVIDVDYFKKFNDTYGHLAGDEVLRSIGRVLVEQAGPEAVVARYGGEEFALILPWDTDRAVEILERIRASVSHHVVEFDGYRLQGLSVSIGVASYPTHGGDDRDILLKADSAMYWGAKQRGRNRIAVYAPEFDVQLFIDELTGLDTIHFANIRLREAFSKGVHAWGAICLDINRFGQVNAQFGFETGDKVLKEMSLVIKECLRHGELACRYGGDEFLVLLPNVGQAEIEAVADRIDRAIATHRFHDGPGVVIPVRARCAVRAFARVDDSLDLFDQVGTLFASLNRTVDESLA
ncbi:MAG: sensor domain-containing diguanylate cyclase [Alicyclobacillus sp.]|nr:sensor domain-containing diguanylate cyclase [Alicyclobacillus sp.]